MARLTREAWKQHVAACRASGLTTRQFAARIGVNANTLAHWKWRLAAEGESLGEPVSFVELGPSIATVVGGHDDDGRLEVVCRGGRTVRVPRDFDPAALLRLIDALERA
jgi:hypothetical protein